MSVFPLERSLAACHLIQRDSHTSMTTNLRSSITAFATTLGATILAGCSVAPKLAQNKAIDVAG